MPFIMTFVWIFLGRRVFSIYGIIILNSVNDAFGIYTYNHSCERLMIFYKKKCNNCCCTISRFFTTHWLTEFLKEKKPVSWRAAVCRDLYGVDAARMCPASDRSVGKRVVVRPSVRPRPSWSPNCRRSSSSSSSSSQNVRIVRGSTWKDQTHFAPTLDAARDLRFWPFLTQTTREIDSYYPDRLDEYSSAAVRSSIGPRQRAGRWRPRGGSDDGGSSSSGGAFASAESSSGATIAVATIDTQRAPSDHNR